MKKLVSLLVALCLLGTVCVGFSAMAEELEDSPKTLIMCAEADPITCLQLEKIEFSTTRNCVKYTTYGSSWKEYDYIYYDFACYILDENGVEVKRVSIPWDSVYKLPADFEIDWSNIPVGKYEMFLAAYLKGTSELAVVSSRLPFAVVPATEKSAEEKSSPEYNFPRNQKRYWRFFNSAR